MGRPWLTSNLDSCTSSSPLAGLGAATSAAAESHAAGPDVLSSLAIILCVAAVTTVVFQRIHQPVVLGYLLAGLIVGPHMPVPLFADLRIAHLRFPLAALLGLGLLALAVPLWRGAADLHGHVRAGAQVILEALGTQSHTDAGGTAVSASTPTTDREVHDLLPGMGRAGSLHLREGDHAVGRSLKETNLRGETGASVIAIQRAGGPVFPSADAQFAVGDTLVLTGTEEAVAAARALLTNGPERRI